MWTYLVSLLWLTITLVLLPILSYYIGNELKPSSYYIYTYIQLAQYSKRKRKKMCRHDTWLVRLLVYMVRSITAIFKNIISSSCIRTSTASCDCTSHKVAKSMLKPQNRTVNIFSIFLFVVVKKINWMNHQWQFNKSRSL